MADKIIIPTKTSQLLNDSGYLTEAEVQVLLDNLMIDLNGVTIQIVYPVTVGSEAAFKAANYVTINGVKHSDNEIFKVAKGTSITVTTASNNNNYYNGVSYGGYNKTFVADVSHLIEFSGLSDYQGAATITSSAN